MIKRVVVTGLKARGYVDGRYVGEEKKEPNSSRDEAPRGLKRRGKAGPAGVGAGMGRGKKRGIGAVGAGADNFGNTTGNKRGRRGKAQGRGGKDGQVLAGATGQGNGIGIGQPPRGEPRGPRGQPRTQSRKNTFGKLAGFGFFADTAHVADLRR